MATLERIRKRAGLLVGFVGLALFAFIIGDLLNSGSSFMNSNQNNVVVVDGEAVDYQEFNKREEELVEIAKLQSGQSSLPESYMSQIRQSVYDEIVMDKIMSPRLKNLGIVVTSEEMSDMVEGENISPILFQSQMFQDPQTGMFDRNYLIMFLNNIKNIETFPENIQGQLMQGKVMWMFLEKNIKQNRLSEKYIGLLSKAIVANSLEAKDAFANSSESSDIAYIMKAFSSVPDTTINISAAEIEQLYNQRKEMFRQQEACIIDYIAVDIAPSAEDYDAAAKEMEAIRAEMETTDNIAALTNEKSENKFVNAYFSVNGFGTETDVIDFVNTAEINDIAGPSFKNDTYRILKLVDKIEGSDSVSVSEIILAARATEAETRVYADSLLNAIKGGADFTELVQLHSIDEQQVAQSNGDLGWITEAGALQGRNEEFRKSAFSLPLGQSAIVKTNYGFHIIKVTDKTKNVPKYKIADVIYTVTPSSATRNLLYSALNQFTATNNTVEKFAASARESGYDIITNAQVHSIDVMVGSVTGARQVVRWAFNNKKGQISDIIECDNKFVVATHKGRLPEGYQSLASVTPQLKSELATRKKGEEMAAELKARNLSSISAYAEAMSINPDTVTYITMETSRITNIGIEPKLNALISLAPVNSLNGPVAGNNGIYVFEVINRIIDNGNYDEKAQINMLESNNSYRVSSLAFRFMQQNAEIEDNRIRFY